MFKTILATLLTKLYPTSKVEEEKVDRFLSGPYRTNAGIPWEPLYPIVEKQRTLHQWDWALNAPEKGVPNDRRSTSIVHSCKLCGAISMMSHREPRLRYLIGWGAMFTPQPICPTTCQETIELMKTSPLTLTEKQRYYDMWNEACRDVNRHYPQLA